MTYADVLAARIAVIASERFEIDAPETLVAFAHHPDFPKWVRPE